MEFLKYIGNLPFFIIGLIFVVIAILILIRNNKFKKYGKNVKLKVISCQKKYTDGEETGYNTEFEFEYNGETKLKTVNTDEEFIVGEIYDGLYLENYKTNDLMVEETPSIIGAIICIIFGIIGIITSFII